MSRVEFKVSSKTARLIGRENITGSDGALIELIKNSYDADASCVYIKMDIPFPNIPNKIKKSYVENILTYNDYIKVLRYYRDDDGLLNKLDLSEKDNDYIKNIFFSYNSIILADNGIGMAKNIIETVWMNIGTNDKEINTHSPKGRIKTGAKGIGRFALDKLSQKSKMYTKHKDECMYCWQLDWNQFENAKFLNQVYAELKEINNYDFSTKVYEVIGKNFTKFNKYDWESGTILILTPLRDVWSNRMYNKINNNLKSINPLGSIDKFDVYIDNLRNNTYNYLPEEVAITESDYDYYIHATFDGEDTLDINIKRNEVNNGLENIKLIIDDKEYEYSTKEFWNRKAFKVKNHYKENYNQEIKILKKVSKELKEDDIEQIRQVGKFSLGLYFTKSQKSDFEIIKSINASRRKKLLSSFKGVKLYRDKFKVRPYGDEEDFDWLGLGMRAQKSPVSITHPTGVWRVLPYQMFGWINIGRFSNIKLVDQANREGLAQNDAFYIFKDIIKKVIESFEYDRQYVYREFKKWRNEKEELECKNLKIIESIKKKKEEQKLNSIKKKKGEQNSQIQIETPNNEKENYSIEDVEDVVIDLMQENDDKTNIKQILMAFGSSGVIVNTFFHEFSRIATDFSNRTSFLELCVNYILKDKGFEGDEDYNPYPHIKDIHDTDELLGEWLNVIMESVQKDKMIKEEVNLVNFIENIISRWTPLMSKKYIKIIFNTENDEVIMNVAEIELYLIFNNFFLNAAWFLESQENKNRIITISLKKDKDIVIVLKNNGPKLEDKYKDNPNKIFNAGETTKKEKGTGLGLWITKEAVERNDGQIHVLNKENGFGLEIIFNSKKG